MSTATLDYARPIFEETQRLRIGRGMRVFNVVIVLLGVVAYGVLFALSRDRGIRFAAGMILVAAAMAFVVPLFLLSRMTTRVDGEGVHVRFGAFPWRTIRAGTIASVEPCTYDAFKEFNGYGMRLRQKGVGDCYTISGDQGVRLTSRGDDPKVLIGTQRQAALVEALRSLIAPPGNAITPPE